MNNTLFIYFLFLPFLGIGQRLLLVNQNPEPITVYVCQEKQMFALPVEVKANSKLEIPIQVFYRYELRCEHYKTTYFIVWQPNTLMIRIFEPNKA